jgi:hypothetical protein
MRKYLPLILSSAVLLSACGKETIRETIRVEPASTAAQAPEAQEPTEHKQLLKEEDSFLAREAGALARIIRTLESQIPLQTSSCHQFGSLRKRLELLKYRVKFVGETKLAESYFRSISLSTGVSMDCPAAEEYKELSWREEVPQLLSALEQMRNAALYGYAVYDKNLYPRGELKLAPELYKSWILLVKRVREGRGAAKAHSPEYVEKQSLNYFTETAYTLEALQDNFRIFEVELKNKQILQEAQSIMRRIAPLNQLSEAGSSVVERHTNELISIADALGKIIERAK